MKGRRALLFTSDTEFESVVRQALLGTDTIFLIARTVSDALQIACQRGRELDLAIMTFGEDCHGMTLLSASMTALSNCQRLSSSRKIRGMQAPSRMRTAHAFV
jgi:hypothetical protein